MGIEIYVKNGLSLEEETNRKLIDFGIPPEEIARGFTNISHVYESMDEFDQALELLHKALRIYNNVPEAHVQALNLNEAKQFCEMGIEIYVKNGLSLEEETNRKLIDFGIPPEEIARGFTNISHVYESMDEFDQALELLHKALRIYNNVPGQQSMIASIKAQMGVIKWHQRKEPQGHHQPQQPPPHRSPMPSLKH
nr:hypothetical protein [Tanacetum cinerariifolium]